MYLSFTILSISEYIQRVLLNLALENLWYPASSKVPLSQGIEEASDQIDATVDPGWIWHSLGYFPQLVNEDIPSEVDWILVKTLPWWIFFSVEWICWNIDWFGFINDIISL